MSYDGLTTMSAAVAKQDSLIISADLPGPEGRGWSRAAGSIPMGEIPELDEQWQQNLIDGTKVMVEETYVPANDPHYDAKCWPCVHPYGTGSLLSEAGTGGTHAHARNRLCQPQRWFRRSAVWGFYAT